MGRRLRQRAVQAPTLPLPVRIKRVDPANLGTLHAGLICKCDDGCDYVVKDGTGHPLIPHAEWFCTHLADLLSLPGLPCRVVELHDSSGAVQRLFGSRWEEGEIPKSPTPWWELVKTGIIPIAEIAPILSRIYVFDNFIHNIDRHFNNFFVRKSHNSFSILSVDYSKAWTYKGFPPPDLPFDLTDREHRTVLVQRASAELWGAWFNPIEADRILDGLRLISAEKIREIIESHPNEWISQNKKRDIIRWWRSKRRLDLLDAIDHGVKNGVYL